MTAASLRSAFAWLISRVGWLVAAIIFALGSAGLVTALDHRPGGAARAELTWPADEAARPPLDALVRDLDGIAGDFATLGEQGRGALAALVATASDTLDATLETGHTLIVKIELEVTAARQHVADLPGDDPRAEGRLSSDTRRRIATVGQALDATDGTAVAWARLSAGSTLATRLTVLLNLHDAHSADAVRLGSQGKYVEALGALDQADPALADARAVRDQIANTADVSTLTQWLDRNAAIDIALRRLYEAASAPGGVGSQATREAYDLVRKAQQELPPDTRALVVVMADIARAGLNQAVIRIEETRGKLVEAIARLGGVPDPNQTP